VLLARHILRRRAGAVKRCGAEYRVVVDHWPELSRPAGPAT
jgi:hypothetical protein